MEPSGDDDLRIRLARLERDLEASELELERAHRLLDTWGVPREEPDPDGGRPLELSLEGRLELLPDDSVDPD